MLAPHPDDETIAAGGILQEALRLSLPVKVTVFTNGDNNEMSFALYQRHLVVSRQELLHMGELRRKESTAAMSLLGLPADGLTFLGYPDFGTMDIFKKHWGSSPPLRSMLTQVTGVPYPECLSPQAPYAGESILTDLKTIIIDFRPTIILAPMPEDMNPDHRSLYLFLKITLWDLTGKIPPPVIYGYPVHALNWPRPLGFFPQLDQVPPLFLSSPNIQKYRYNLTDPQIEKKKTMIDLYRTQTDYSARFLHAFARKNEIFTISPHIITLFQHEDSINWNHVTKYPATPVSHMPTHPPPQKRIEALQFTTTENSLCIKIFLQKLITKERGIDIFLFGYNQTVPFGEMPKIRLHIGWESKMLVFDKETGIHVNNAGFSLADQGKEILIHFPLTALRHPHFILTHTVTHTHDLPLEATAWHILELRNNHAK